VVDEGGLVKYSVSDYHPKIIDIEIGRMVITTYKSGVWLSIELSSRCLFVTLFSRRIELRIRCKK
jgi:hypothetical protein